MDAPYYHRFLFTTDVENAPQRDQELSYYNIDVDSFSSLAKYILIPFYWAGQIFGASLQD